MLATNHRFRSMLLFKCQSVLYSFIYINQQKHHFLHIYQWLESDPYDGTDWWLRLLSVWSGTDPYLIRLCLRVSQWSPTVSSVHSSGQHSLNRCNLHSLITHNPLHTLWSLPPLLDTVVRASLSIISSPHPTSGEPIMSPCPRVPWLPGDMCYEGRCSITGHCSALLPTKHSSLFSPCLSSGSSPPLLSLCPELPNPRNNPTLHHHTTTTDNTTTSTDNNTISHSCLEIFLRNIFLLSNVVLNGLCVWAPISCVVWSSSVETRLRRLRPWSRLKREDGCSRLLTAAHRSQN